MWPEESIDLLLLKQSPETLDFYTVYRYMFVSVQKGKTRMSKAKMLAAERGATSFVVRDRLTALEYKIKQPIARSK